MAILFIPIYHGVLGRTDTGRVRPNWARHTGLQKEYPNRLVRRACGLTLGQWRDRELLRPAKNQLKRGSRVAAVSETLGSSDPSYCAHWFRKQTGLPPSHGSPA